MRQEIKVMAEYYAIGAISKSQLTGVCFATEIDEAFEYAESYSNKYNKDMTILSDYTKGKISFEELISSRESLDDYGKLMRYGLNVWENSNEDVFKKTGVLVHKFQVNMLLMGDNEEEAFDCIKDAFTKGYSLGEVSDIICSYAKLIDKKL